MKFRLMFLLVLACLTLSACRIETSKAFQPTTRGKSEATGKTVSSKWYEGGEGYDKAYAEFVATKAPAVVYFYTDW